jgi:hypothetical protein
MAHWRDEEDFCRPRVTFGAAPALIAFAISMALWAGFIWSAVEFGR